MINKYKKIIACGGLVVCQNKVLLIYKRGEWDLPKGKIKTEQNKTECALAEVSEETGIDVEKIQIAGKLPTTHHMSNYKGGKVYKKTHWFLMNYSGGLDDVTPEVSEDIDGCVWFNKDKLLDIQTHKHIEYLLDLSIRQLKV